MTNHEQTGGIPKGALTAEEINNTLEFNQREITEFGACATQHDVVLHDITQQIEAISHPKSVIERLQALQTAALELCHHRNIQGESARDFELSRHTEIALDFDPLDDASEIKLEGLVSWVQRKSYDARRTMAGFTDEVVEAIESANPAVFTSSIAEKMQKLGHDREDLIDYATHLGIDGPTDAEEPYRQEAAEINLKAMELVAGANIEKWEEAASNADHAIAYLSSELQNYTRNRRPMQQIEYAILSEVALAEASPPVFAISPELHEWIMTDEEVSSVFRDMILKLDASGEVSNDGKKMLGVSIWIRGLADANRAKTMGLDWANMSDDDRWTMSEVLWSKANVGRQKIQAREGFLRNTLIASKEAARKIKRKSAHADRMAQMTLRHPDYK